MCAVDECTPWDLYTETRPKARREHRCSECGRTIRPGERYQRVKGVTEGEWSTHATCDHCWAAGKFMVQMCDGYPVSGLLGDLVEHWYEGYRSVPLARLIVGMRRGWHDGRDAVPSGCGEMASELMAGAVR